MNNRSPLQASSHADLPALVGHEGGHLLQFYKSDEFLASVVAGFLGSDLKEHEGALVIATPSHWAQFSQALEGLGHDVRALTSSGRLVVLNAETTLEQILVDGQPAAHLFRSLIEETLASIKTRSPRDNVRAYGELVDLLWRRGNAAAAIRLEELWNAFLAERPVSLLCAYRMGSFYKEARGLHDVCSAHSHVLPPERETKIADLRVLHPGDGVEFVTEVAHRREVERALRETICELRGAEEQRKAAEVKSGAGTRRSERLLRITAGIANAISAEQVFEAVVDQVARALDASTAALWMVKTDEATIRLKRCVGYSAEQLAQFDDVALDATFRFPTLDSVQSGEPIWLSSSRELIERYPNLAGALMLDRQCRIVSLPMVVEGHTIGALGFTFAREGPFEEDERSFLMLVARYSAQALERLRLYEENREALSRAELLYRLVGSVISARNVEEVFAASLDTLEQALSADRSSILVFDAQGVMRFRAWRKLSEHYRAGTEGHSPWSRETQHPEPIVVPDVERDPAMASFLPLFRHEGIGSLAFIPLVASGQLIGKFMLYYERPRRFRPQDIELAQSIASNIATTVARFDAVAELERAVRFHETFTAILGHDLRNPLAGIIATAEVGLVREHGDHPKKYMRIINSGERMARMIDQLLDFTRERMGAGIPLHPQPADLASILKEITAELGVAHAQWKLSLELEGDLEGTWDQDRLAQVFSNLLGNAIQHGVREEGVRLRADGCDASTVEVEVQNGGVVPGELLPTLFEPMSGSHFRGKNSGGLGLGLYISQQIIRSHGGTIAVRSSESEGTSFLVKLPRARRWGGR